MIAPEELCWGADGLLPAVVQDVEGGDVLMVAWMSAEALRRTLEGPHAVFWSRSRRSLWTKGETSGNHLEVVSVRADCDADTILILVKPAGPACHTGEPSCFFEHLTDAPVVDRLGSVLARLAATLAARAGADTDVSYTARLLAGGPAAYGEKLREEADELARACAGEVDDRVAAEAADLLYHLLVALSDRGVDLATVASVLTAREGRSGLEEKRGREPL